MLHVTCVPCGIDGILLADESTDIPRCLQCGQPFRVAPHPKGHSRDRGRPTDDLIVTWLSQGPAPPSPAKACDFACGSCGFVGPTPRKNWLGVVACPACGEFDRPRRRHGGSKTVCPDCGLVFELSVHDRGRTVLCPGCNYFLGCLVPDERARNKPFWSRS
jgi:hypothetical protein